jgi:hypothetical protein
MEHLPEEDPPVPSLQAKRLQKLREFREYLVQKEVVLALVKCTCYSVLLALKKSENPPDNPAQYLQDYFGEYRDPAWDEIDRMKAEVEDMKAREPQLTEEIERMKGEIQRAKRVAIVQKTYRTLDPDNTGVVGTKQLVAKLSGFGRFEVDLKLSRQDFTRFVMDFLLTPQPGDSFDPWELFQVLQDLPPPTTEGKPKPPIFQGHLDDPKYMRILERIKAFSTG